MIKNEPKKIDPIRACFSIINTNDVQHNLKFGNENKLRTKNVESENNKTNLVHPGTQLRIGDNVPIPVQMVDCIVLLLWCSCFQRLHSFSEHFQSNVHRRST